MTFLLILCIVRVFGFYPAMFSCPVFFFDLLWEVSVCAAVMLSQALIFHMTPTQQARNLEPLRRHNLIRDINPFGWSWNQQWCCMPLLVEAASSKWASNIPNIAATFADKVMLADCTVKEERWRQGEWDKRFTRDASRGWTLGFTVYEFGLYSQLVEFCIKILKIRSGQLCVHCPLESEGKKQFWCWQMWNRLKTDDSSSFGLAVTNIQ